MIRAGQPARGNSKQGTGDMREHGLRQDMIREWMAPPEDKRQTEDHRQRIANAFFFSVTIFAVAFAFFVPSARAHEIAP
jgi:hypothetical protein